MPEVSARFDVTQWDPTPFEDAGDGPGLHRLSVRKTFRGELEGETVGEGMACRMDAPEEGAGYLVMDRFVGRLGDHEGSFVMQHMGVAEPGERPVSTGVVVPGSGTGALEGLRGDVSFSMPHTLTLSYELPPTADAA